LPTQYFLRPLSIGEEFTFELEVGKKIIIRLIAVGPINESNGHRDVFFLLNGEARVVDVIDSTGEASKSIAAGRPKASADKKG
jgi:pyruvate carboxylase